MALKSTSSRFQKGKSGNARGRPKGRRSKISVMLEDARVALATRDGISPLQLLISVYRDATLPMTVRMAAASIALPYVHRKMPITVEGAGPDRSIYDLSRLADPELLMLRTLLEKARLNEEPAPFEA